MKVVIKYFGPLAELMGTSEQELETTAATVGDLIHDLYLEAPKLKQEQFQIAVNKHMANLQTVLTLNAEIAFLPPFSGG